MPNLTPQQTDFIDAVRATVSDPAAQGLMLIARAGTGKTFTLKQAAAEIPAGTSTLAVAFNKRIQQELSEAMPAHVRTLTLNSLGHRTWMRYINRQGAPFNTEKIMGLVRKHVRAHPEDLPQESFIVLRQLVDKCRTNGLVPRDTPGAHFAQPLHPDSEDTWAELCDGIDDADHPEYVQLARAILNESIHLAFQGEIDFGDQIYMPTLWGASFDKHDLVLIDEAQDLSPLQHKMLAKCLRGGSERPGRLIAVGDPRQAIYAFRGASHNSMTELQEHFNLRALPLTVSFRCPQDVVHEAARICEDFEPHPNAPQGLVSTLQRYTAADFPFGAAVVCRMNAPLVRLGFRLIKSGIGVEMLGRDLGRGLKTLTNKLAGGKDVEMSMQQFVPKLDAWAQVERRKAQDRDQHDKVERINDKYESICILMDGCDNVSELRDAIDNLFSRSSGKITLSTIHRAKGLEWDVVYFLDPHKCPNRRITELVREFPDEYGDAYQQELNMRYVAITRAKRQLTYIYTRGWTDANETQGAA
jgi:superfamily I DNA/RNA helicase